MLKKNKIYRGDCLKLLKKIDDNSVDLIIADPPYGIKKDFGNGENWSLDKHEEWFSWTQAWLKEATRVLKGGGSIFVYGIHHNIGYVQTHLYKLGLNYGRQFIWYYENGWSKYKKSPASHYEPLLWFYKEKKYTYHEIRIPYKSTERLKYKITKNGKTWSPNPAGKLAGDVWNIPVLAGKRFESERIKHPTQKPLAICNRIINHFSNKGGLVLVPFAGSGSECVSAKSNGRDFIGIELNANYLKIANKRLQKVDISI